jgi:predicted amidohydrolase YtcJ
MWIELGVICFALVSWCAAAPARGEPTVHVEPADLVVLGATVITVDPVRPDASAFAVSAGRFVAVGSDADVEPFVGPATTVLKLAGKTITPGFIDAHLHPRVLFPELHRLGRIDCTPAATPTIDALIERIKTKAAATPKGEMIRGRGYKDTVLGHHPTRYELDRASTEHPIVLTHSSGHLCVANSLALSISSITRDTKDPDGGMIERDASGEPTGLLKEDAMGLIKSRGDGLRPTSSREERIEGYLNCFDEYLAAGITAVGVAGASDGDLADYEAANRVRPTVRMWVMMRPGDIDETASRMRAGYGDAEWIRLGGIKVFHGNSLSGRTCWLSEPYLNRPDYFGIPPDRSQADLDELVLRIHRAGLQACIHANGDREIDMVLSAYERALKAMPREDRRHRIEHASVMTQALMDRVKAAGVVLAPHSYIWEHGDTMEEYGEKRWPMMHPNGTAVKMGIIAAGNSDSPVSEARPMLRIQSLVTRQCNTGKVYGPEQKITAFEAIRSWTLHSAIACRWDKEIGTIEVGKRADFVVLARDPRATEPLEISKIQVERTFVGGRNATVRERTEGKGPKTRPKPFDVGQVR